MLRCNTAFDWLTVWTEPIDLHGVVADEILKVKQHHRQAVQLVGQPEVSKTNVVKRSRHYTKLNTGDRSCGETEPS